MKKIAIFLICLASFNLTFSQIKTIKKSSKSNTKQSTAKQVVAPATFALLPGTVKATIGTSDTQETLSTITLHLIFALTSDPPKKDIPIVISIFCDQPVLDPKFSIANPILTDYKLKITIPASSYIAPSNTFKVDVDVKYHIPKDTLKEQATAFVSIEGRIDPRQVYTLKFVNGTVATKINSTKSTQKPVDVKATAPTTMNDSSKANNSLKTDTNSKGNLNPKLPKPPTKKTSVKSDLIKTIRLISVSPRSTDNPIFTDTVKLTFNLSATTDSNTIVKHKLRILSFDSKEIQPQFYGNPGKPSNLITISDSVKKGSNTFQTSIVFCYHNPASILVSPVSANIVVDGDPNLVDHSYTINFTNKSDVNEVAPFWIEAGANFDLIKGGSPNNFYTGAFAFEKETTDFKPFGFVKWFRSTVNKDTKSKRPKARGIDTIVTKVSFTAGVYESQSSSTSVSSDSGMVYRDGSSYLKTINKILKVSGYPYYRDIGNITTTTNVQSIGIFFSPHFLLTSKPTTENGWHLYLSIYAEVLWQQIKTSFDYSNSKVDSSLTKYALSLDSLYSHNYKETSINLDYRSQYFGLGLPIYVKHNDYTFYLNSVFGFTNQKFVLVQDHLPPASYKTDYRNYKQNPNLNPDPNPLIYGFLVPYNAWNSFYVEQFRLTSEEYGITFTGEVRGLLLHNSKPIITLSLSKKLDPGKFFASIFGKGSSSK